MSADATRRAVAAFQRALETGDLQSLLDLLAPDVVLLGDGGGVRQTVLRPIVGADKVARLLSAGLPNLAGKVSVEPVQINGWPGLIIRMDGDIDNVVAMRLDDGLVTGLYLVRNPAKLSRVEQETVVSRL